MAKRRPSKNPIPLIVEDHPDNYDGYPFITLIQYDKKHFLTIIDNATEKTIEAYVLDMCGPAGISEEGIVAVAEKWYNESRERYPLSFEFSRLGVSDTVGKIHRTFNIEFISRVIGPLPKFAMTTQEKVRRRRRKGLPKGVRVQKKVSPIR